jgi:hypothetical protein
MKLLSTATLAAALLSYVAANVSKVELHQRALRALSDRKSHHAFSRQLNVSTECSTNQEELELTGINDVGDAVFCDKEKKGDFTKIECDYDGLTFDSFACANAGGGQIIKIYKEIDCEEFNEKHLNMTQCLHFTCDADEYYQMIEDNYNSEPDDIFGRNCNYTVSGAAIGRTNIISCIAPLVLSLLAMLW